MYVSHEEQGLKFNLKCFSYFFPLHLNTCVMCLRPLEMFYSFSAGIDFRCQNLTALDVRFWRLKSIPALKRLTKLVWRPPHLGECRAVYCDWWAVLITCRVVYTVIGGRFLSRVRPQYIVNLFKLFTEWHPNTWRSGADRSKVKSTWHQMQFSP